MHSVKFAERFGERLLSNVTQWLHLVAEC